MNNYRCVYRSLLLVFFLFFSRQASAGGLRYNIEDVKFISEGVLLAGTIVKPKQPAAAVVIVHGSGQEKRLMDFAMLLAKNNIAVLTYDKRGVGASEGVYAGPEVGTNNIDSSNLNLLARDASAATNTLKAHLSHKHIPIGLIGFSQAGWIIPLAAKTNPKVSYMVLFSGPVVTALEQLRFQFYTESKPGFWDTHSEAEVRKHIKEDKDRYQFVDTDPVKMLETLSIPGLWIFGGKDVQIPVALSIEHLDGLENTGKPYEYKLFPQLGHNTAFGNPNDAVNVAINWIRALKRKNSKIKTRKRNTHKNNSCVYL